MKYPDILSFAPAPAEFRYDEAFTILYALALGCGADPAELDYVYERRLRTMPTMAVLMSGGAGEFISQAGIDLRRVVHGEQRLTVHVPLPSAGTMLCETRCIGVADKGAGKGAVVHLETAVRCADRGSLHATTLMSLFCRGDGGFGGPSENLLQGHPRPPREPDATVALPTLVQQAAIYRLLGDRNPLHIDPSAARAVGFTDPILHGLCTYGIAARAIMRACCHNDAAAIAHIAGRFSSPVFPGETLVTRIWYEGEEIAFECRVSERDVTVIENGLCRLRSP